MAVRFLVVSEQVPGLSEAETARLYAAMKDFYEAVPDGVVLECDYVRADRRGSYSVLTVPDRAALDRILAPFEGLCRLQVVEVLTAAEAMAGAAAPAG